jgi:hypothetical protein
MGMPGQDMSFQAALMPGEQGGMPTPAAGRMNPAQMLELQKMLPSNQFRPPNAAAASPAGGSRLGELDRIGGGGAGGAGGQRANRIPLSLYRILNGGV